MSLLQGAEGLLQRNLFRGNPVSGLRLEGGSRAEIHASRFLENGAGIQSVSSAISLFDSLIAGSAQPILAARGRSTFSELRWYPPMEAAKGSLSGVFRAKQPESVRTGP